MYLQFDSRDTSCIVPVAVAVEIPQTMHDSPCIVDCQIYSSFIDRKSGTLISIDPIDHVSLIVYSIAFNFL